MLSTSPTSKVTPATLRNSGLSIALHVAVLGGLVFHHPAILKPTQLPGDITGHVMLLTYAPGARSVSTTPQASKPAADRLPSLHTVPVSAPPASVAAPSTTGANSNTTGSDSLGDGDIRIASVLNHPPPHPDLNVLPAGTRGDVIVDVVIDAQGNIARFTLSRGLGHGVDDTVLATIQHWTFQPATRNGIPVASEQELLFHFERG